MVIHEGGTVKGVWMISLGVLLVLLLTAAVWAGYSAEGRIHWSVMSGGGAPAVSGVAGLNGSLGQTAAGPSSAGDLHLGAGYWYGVGGGGPSWEYQAYLPLVLRNH